MYNIINGIAPSYLTVRANSFAIKSFFLYTGIKHWNALPSATQLISNKQAFKLKVKKLLWLKLIQMDEEICFFFKFLNNICIVIYFYSVLLYSCILI